MIESLIKARIEKTIGGRYLNIGSGEGDLDLDINEYCQELYACDINESDVLFSKKNNPNISYTLQDAERLEYEDNFFDTVVCMEVIEHVNNKEKVINEINRVLKPQGYLIITFPSDNYPFTYDPLNYILRNINIKFPIGAHSFGHLDLIKDDEINKLFNEYNFEIIEKKYLSRYISSIFEMYWIGFLQKVLKKNSNNSIDNIKPDNFYLRPNHPIVSNFWLTNLINYFDEFFILNNSKKSVGLGYLLKKKF